MKVNQPLVIGHLWIDAVDNLHLLLRQQDLKICELVNRVEMLLLLHFLLLVLPSLYFGMVLMGVHRIQIGLKNRIVMLIHQREATFHRLVINTTEAILLPRLLLKEIDEDLNILLHQNLVLIRWLAIYHRCHKILYMSDETRDILLETNHHVVMMIEQHLREMTIARKMHTLIKNHHLNNNHHVLRVKHTAVVMMHTTVKKGERLIVKLDLISHQGIFVIHFHRHQLKQHTREMNSLSEEKILLLDATIIRWVGMSSREEMISYHKDMMTSRHREGIISNSLQEEKSSHHHQHGGGLISPHLLETRMNFHIEEERSLLGEMNFQEDHETNFQEDHEMSFQEDHGRNFLEDHERNFLEDHGKNFQEDHGKNFQEDHGRNFH